MSGLSDLILPILQRNTGCFPIQNRPVFSQFWRFFPNLKILLGFIIKFKRHRLYPKNGNKITGPVGYKLFDTRCSENVDYEKNICSYKKTACKMKS